MKKTQLIITFTFLIFIFVTLYFSLDNRKIYNTENISRNTVKFVREKVYDTDISDEHLESRGWKQDENTGKWKHPSYNNKTFDSLIINTKNGRKEIPYSGSDDIEGLGYNYIVSGGGQYRTV